MRKKTASVLVILMIIYAAACSQEVRVLLYKGRGTMEFTGDYYRSDRFRVRLNKIDMYDGRIFINGRDTDANVIRLAPEDGTIRFQGREYRGDLLILTDYFNLIVINAVEMEAYLKGVLPKEISPGWPDEAIKAQAVAARTFAYRMIHDNGEHVYHLDATHMSQVYGGKTGESQSTNKAVESTKNLILTYRGRPIKAFYHSSSGGVTSRPSEVWKTDDKDYPYLKSFEDPFSNHSPNMSWEYEIPLHELTRRFHIAGLRTIRVVHSGSGRAISVEFVTETGRVEVSGNDFRLKLGAAKVKSTLFSAAIKNGMLCLKGKGWGHGVGMSQWGAYKMALKGYGYKDILAFYYRDVDLRKVRG